MEIGSPFTKDEEQLRWFLLPSEAAAILQNRHMEIQSPRPFVVPRELYKDKKGKQLLTEFHNGSIPHQILVDSAFRNPTAAADFIAGLSYSARQDLSSSKESFNMDSNKSVLYDEWERDPSDFEPTHLTAAQLRELIDSEIGHLRESIIDRVNSIYLHEKA
jgi:hypothetical protein